MVGIERPQYQALKTVVGAENLGIDEPSFQGMESRCFISENNLILMFPMSRRQLAKESISDIPVSSTEGRAGQRAATLTDYFRL